MSFKTSSQNMACNKNCNNNHNSPEVRPLQESVKTDKENAVAPRNETLEETRQVVRRFLERSLSQNAKNSMTFLKPEGYHRLKRDGKLQFYQRQQSKPEQGSLMRKDSNVENSQASQVSQKRTQDPLSHTTLPSRPSLNELTSASKTSAFPGLAKNDQILNKSEDDVRTLQKLSESNTPDQASNNLMYQLIGPESQVGDDSLHSSDSFLSASEDGVKHHIRRKSFSKAMSRKSVISFIESKRKIQETDSKDTTCQADQAAFDRRVESDVSTKTKSLHRRESSMNEEKPSRPQISDLKDEEAGRSGRTLEKKASFSVRFKKMMASTSNKRKLKYKKSFEQPKPEEPSGSSDSWRSSERRSASGGTASTPASSEAEFHKSSERLTHSANSATSNSSGKSVIRQSSSLKHPPSSSHDRSSSPVKNKPQHASMVLLRSLSMKSKSSPKPNRRPLHQSGSSSSLSQCTVSAPVGGQLERNKSGSLPVSMRYGVHQQVYSAKNERRHSEDFHPPASSNKHSASKRNPPRHGAMERPKHLDLNSKKTKSTSKLRRFFQRLRKRHTSESSTGSSRSQSLPSIPAALELENEAQEKDVDTDNESSAKLLESASDDDRLLTSSDEPRPYHHRGSLSFSSGDLDGLSLPENQKIYNDIAETLRRLSTKYNQQIQSSSSTPGSKITTPESSLTSEEHGQYARAFRSSPPSQQTSISSSKVPVHASGKSYRKYKLENQPALTAYYNMRVQGRSSDPHVNNVPRSLPIRRHTHHAQTGSLDSPFVGDKHPPTRSPGFPKPDKPHGTPAPPHDVTDGPPASRTSNPANSSSWESNVECTETDCAVRDFHPRPTQLVRSPANHSIASSHDGSDVDVPSRHQHLMSPDQNRSQESRPSTSRANSESESNGIRNMEPEDLDEDKLVDKLVDALCKKGDEYTRSIDAPNGLPLEPVFRSSMIRYMSRVTYHHFEYFAKRFCQNFKQLVEPSPARHPDIFPMVMVFNMTQLIVNLATSEATQDAIGHAQAAVNHVLTLSTQLVTNIVQDQGNNWEAVLSQLHDTEEELIAAEIPNDSPRRHINTDDELD